MQRQNRVPHYPLDYEAFALSDMLGPPSTADFPAIGSEGLFPLPIPHQSSGCTADLGRKGLLGARGGSFSLSQPSNVRSSHPQAALDFSSLQQSDRDTLQPVPSRSLPEFLTRDKIRDRQDSPPENLDDSRIHLSTKEIVREQNRRAAARFRQRQKVRSCTFCRCFTALKADNLQPSGLSSAAQGCPDVTLM